MMEDKEGGNLKKMKRIIQLNLMGVVGDQLAGKMTI